ncbi:lasso peptide biosynthesis B2 protein [Desulfobacter latus]|uniref:lasso peptide biosynthesis B2 protein n=1 Tax=Desulfobacter latus TaxID=2292 RepID=UPI001C49A9F0|nr:lasso peptide biosynthesis B2 protein [Desulfobacter latus]
MEAYVWLGLSRAAILLIPFRRIAPLLGRTMTITPDYELPDMTRPLQISWAVRTAARFTPWESKCLAQAMSARIMLKRRGYPTTLYLGLAKKADNELSAHAWLRCGSRILTGGLGHGRFTVISTFGDLT